MNLLIISSLSVFIPLIVFIVRANRGMDTFQRLVGLYVLVGALIEVTMSLLFTSDIRFNNMPILHAYTVFEFGLFCWIIGKQINLSARIRSLLIAGFVVIEVALDIWVQPITEINSIIRSIESIILITLVILYFRQIMQRMEVPHLEKAPEFWVATAILLYFSGSLVIFAFSNYMHLKDPNLNLNIWTIHAVPNIILNLLLAIGLWMKPTRLN